MLPPLAIPVCHAVHVPSGVPVLPARASIVIVCPFNVVAYESVVNADFPPVLMTAEVKVPEEA